MYIIVKTLHIRQLTSSYSGKQEKGFLTNSLVAASWSQTPSCATFPILFLTVNWAIVNVNLVCF